MGILRADRITGLGGANAITGSVNFTNDGATSTGDYLRVDRKDNNDFNLSTNDFTIELWMYSRNVGASLHLVTFAASTVSASSDAGFYVRQFGGVVQGYCFEGNNTIGAVATGSVSVERWYHIAYVRSGSTFTMYLDGTSTATATSSAAANFDAGWNLNIGSAYTNVYHYNGYISNLRIINGTALYTSNFTVPNTRLTNVSNTVLLACQSSGNVLQEGTNKNIHLVKASSDNAGPVASRFTPNSPVGFSTTTDVGSQYGTTFDGFTVFATSTYLVPPGGNTRERNRGRGVLGGGAPFVSPNVLNNMSFVEVQSQGNFQDFGDLTVSRGQFPAGQNASSTRGLSSGGWTSPVGVNTIDFITISNTANAIDFGDTAITRPNAVLSNQTRSLTAGNGDLVNTIDFVTIATAGNASDFGDLVDGRANLSGVSSPTRGVFGGGRNNTPSSNTEYNTLQYITIATTGNTQDFGDLTRTRYGSSGFSSPTRGIFAGGYSNPQGKFEGIEFITIATLGNGTDFGDLTTTQGYGGSLTNSILGLITINNPSNYHNTIDFITISTTGNAKDFGDADPLGSGKGHGTFPSCMSDSHGGTT